MEAEIELLEQLDANSVVYLRQPIRTNAEKTYDNSIPVYFSNESSKGVAKDHQYKSLAAAHGRYLWADLALAPSQAMNDMPGESALFAYSSASEVTLPSRSAISNLIWGALERAVVLGVRVCNPNGIAQYLLEHTNAIRAIIPAIGAADRAFANVQHQLVLDLYVDPEIDDRYPVLYVRLPDYHRDVLEALERAASLADADTGDSSVQVLITTDFLPLSAS